MKIKVLRTLMPTYRRPGILKGEVYEVKRMLGPNAIVDVLGREVCLDPEEFEEVTDD